MIYYDFYSRSPTYPYYRTIYNKRKHYYLNSKPIHYVRRSSEVNELGCDCYNNSKRNCRISKITFFLIIINIIWLCLQTIVKYLETN